MPCAVGLLATVKLSNRRTAEEKARRQDRGAFEGQEVGSVNQDAKARHCVVGRRLVRSRIEDKNSTKDRTKACLAKERSSTGRLASPLHAPVAIENALLIKRRRDADGIGRKQDPGQYMKEGSFA
mmetsp:Transcript_7222/g.27576  ORF Transcript_7222/g.27576 Transcript_7222/m.27576 type:complete len:125 (-) Transcript_7222:8-382(-)|eukprot:scaffold1305_cov248-Pinguiococcus_pyrenoidosus.AAC.3